MLNDENLFFCVEVETTTICNRKCVYCPNHLFKRPPKFMEAGLFYKIIDDLRSIQFSGRFSPHFYGEPLIDRRIFDFLAYAKSNLPLAFISLFTNGDFLTEASFQKLINIGVDQIRISQHDEILASHLARFFQTLDPDLFIRRVQIVKYFDNHEILMNRGGLIPIDNREKSSCDFVHNLTIDYEGKVLLCCNDYFGNYSFGNVKNENILNIWKKNEYRKVREKILKGNWPFPICQKCVLPARKPNE